MAITSLVIHHSKLSWKSNCLPFLLICIILSFTEINSKPVGIIGRTRRNDFRITEKQDNLFRVDEVKDPQPKNRFSRSIPDVKENEINASNRMVQWNKKLTAKTDQDNTKYGKDHLRFGRQRNDACSIDEMVI